MATIRAAIDARVLHPEAWATLACDVAYDDAEPFAIQFIFSPATTWLIDRGLIRDSLNHPVGLGDVRLWPAAHTGDVWYMHLRVRTEALIEFRRSDIARFLRDTDLIVPPGREMARFDEAELRAWETD